MALSSATPSIADLPRLAYVVNTLNAGGTERLVVQMSLEFARDFNLLVICLDETGDWAEELRCRGIPVHCLWRQPGLDVSMAFALARCFRQHGTQIIHAHQCTAWFYSALARLLYRRPLLLLEEHGRFHPETLNTRRVSFNRLLTNRLTHRFIAVSKDIRDRLARYEGVDLRNIDVIYNGVTAAKQLPFEERAALRRSLGFSPGDFVIGTVGRFDPIKNLPMLVSAAASAAQQNDSIRGLLIGDGPLLKSIEDQIEHRGLAGRVRLTGFRSDARTLVQCLDLFVLASFSEGTSVALLEAMSAGVAVAVTAVGGNPEIVLDGETGWVVPSDSVPALTAAILEAASDSGKRARLSLAGRSRFAASFGFDAMIAAYRREYRQLLGATS